MTDEKEKKRDSAKEKAKKDKSPLDKVLKKIDTSHEIEDKTKDIKQIGNETEEVKQLEDDTPRLQLEYFSKEELSEKIEELSKTLVERETTEKILQEENTKLQKRVMHLQAEFENAQKRWDKSRQNLRTQNVASVLKNFLPLYDSFKKAIDSKTEENQKEIEIITKFFNQFLSVFKSYQAEPVEVKINDHFDYNAHEALTSIEKDDIPENSIIEVIQEGWKLGKEVLRYAKVVISKKPKPPEPEPEPESEEKQEEDGEIKENNEEEGISEEKEIK